ncbi:protein IMPAIRED IN BABA-INDUCED STERILITY 1-like isoform X2 [Diospyros lotus]|uniref:protein IMPAIRED IN BABA-INDUCED STERILITY 1-like isoform X2 n=1 Tax=Diospyros lotus TaxID=55363 RepID=UPI00224D3954|nr:protein IMPAIRED IN BABA-INDUCED STERILITY 1-like isoform X2 [Diospyros lotus]
MGCVTSKESRSSWHGFDSTITLPNERLGFGDLDKIKQELEQESVDGLNKSKSVKKGNCRRRPLFGSRFGRFKELEQIAAGWPPWLSSVAGDAVDGWLPLRADSFEKLDKIGKGTYSTVYRARDVETGRIVALKKVQFDTFQVESVRFMAREIIILRRLDHPNIMKLEGVIASGSSSSIYLVFEYMEHDLSRLLSSSGIKFSDAQIRCYMRQLLAGLDHCHSLGVMHRDIKVSNILVNNEGILKIADFGLANFINARHQQALTSHVVTLWYRPPELLLGSTNYGASVDLWSVGCVFAELYTHKPILKGRTEVEQLHKIFKLCGSPPDEYWKTSILPLATLLETPPTYVNCLRETYRELPKGALDLLETFLSIEPHKRGTASSALDSEYFATKPNDPSRLSPWNKEVDAKMHEEAQRRKSSTRLRAPGTSRNARRACKAFQETNSISKVVPMQSESIRIITIKRKEYNSLENCQPNHLDSMKGGKKTISSKLLVDHGFTELSFFASAGLYCKGIWGHHRGNAGAASWPTFTSNLNAPKSPVSSNLQLVEVVADTTTVLYLA